MKALGFLAVVAIVFGIALGVQYLIWSLWCWTLPQIWENGPKGIIAPSFWLFWAATFLLSIVGKLLFKSSKE